MLQRILNGRKLAIYVFASYAYSGMRIIRISRFYQDLSDNYLRQRSRTIIDIYFETC